MDGEINAEYSCPQLIRNHQVAWGADQCQSWLGAGVHSDGGQLGPGVDLLAAAHAGVHLQQRLLPRHRPGD